MGGCTSAALSLTAVSRRVTRPRSTARIPTRSGPARSTDSSTFTSRFVPPDTWFTYEVEVVNKNWRGKTVPHIKVSINGEVLYELIEYTKAWDQGHFAFQHHDPGSKIQIRKIEVMELDEKGK